MTTVVALLVGRALPFGPSSVPSGIAKTEANGAVWLGHEGLVGDEQGDRKHHGGVEKAVHHYPLDHYGTWRGDLGELPALARPGAFGENIATSGLTERDVAVGDTFRIGTAVVQVSQGRQPCWKLNVRFGVAKMARRVQESGRTGWYYRVLEPGHVAAGDSMTLVDRAAPAFTIHRLWRALYVETMRLDELTAMADLSVLAEPWREHARRRLRTQQVEDWRKRLGDEGP